MVKNLPATQDPQFQFLGREDPLEKGIPTPVFISGEFHRWRSLAGYSPWGCKESDMTESHTHTHTCTHDVKKASYGVARDSGGLLPMRENLIDRCWDVGVRGFIDPVGKERWE